jgi:hypothetical protein
MFIVSLSHVKIFHGFSEEPNSTHRPLKIGDNGMPAEPAEGKSAMGSYRYGELEFFRNIFSCLPRADQRRWAEVYLKGLLAAPGKKSIKNIAGPQASPQDLQSLRQFINQSSWPWDQVTQRYTHLLAAVQSPELWILDSVFIPKRGTASVGASRWFVRKHGQTMNGQLGMALFMSSRRASVPVAWRILLRDRWASARETRRAGGIPDDYRLTHEWEAVLDLIDSAIRAGGLPRRPVAANLQNLPDAGLLISELADRKMEFLFEVDATALPDGYSYSVAGQPGSLTNVVVSKPQEPEFRFVTRVVTQHPVGPEGKPRYWVTNIPQWDIGDLLFSQPVLRRHTFDLTRLEFQYGTRDFAGRSFGGWHRHMVLASAGLAFSVLEGASRPSTDVCTQRLAVA